MPLPLTPAQCRAARNVLSWTLDDLAHAAGISIFTVRDFEGAKRTPDRPTLVLMRRAFEGAGVKFCERSGDVRLASGRC
jgi:DNA-binding transcriptional regulator YiaG